MKNARDFIGWVEMFSSPSVLYTLACRYGAYSLLENEFLWVCFICFAWLAYKQMWDSGLRKLYVCALCPLDMGNMA